MLFFLLPLVYPPSESRGAHDHQWPKEVWAKQSTIECCGAYSCPHYDGAHSSIHFMLALYLHVIFEWPLLQLYYWRVSYMPAVVVVQYKYGLNIWRRIYNLHISTHPSLTIPNPLNSVNYSSIWLPMSIFQTVLFSEKNKRHCRRWNYYSKQYHIANVGISKPSIARNQAISPLRSASVSYMSRTATINAFFLLLLKAETRVKEVKYNAIPRRDPEEWTRAPPLVNRDTMMDVSKGNKHKIRAASNRVTQRDYFASICPTNYSNYVIDIEKSSYCDVFNPCHVLWWFGRKGRVDTFDIQNIGPWHVMVVSVVVPAAPTLYLFL